MSANATATQDKAARKVPEAVAPAVEPAVDLTADLPTLASPQPYGTSGRAVPPEIVKFVEDAYAAWKENPAAWRVVTLSNGAAVGEVFVLARHYAAHRAAPLTFQRKKTGNPLELVYRVRDKITQQKRSDATA